MDLPEKVTCTLKLDGFVIRATDWRVVENLRLNFSPKHLQAPHATARKFKGLKILKSGCAKEIAIGSFRENGRQFTTSMLLHSPNADEEIDGEFIRKSFAKAVDSAVNQLNSDSPSLREYLTSVHSFYDRYTNSCPPMSRYENLTIFSDDVANFGQIFQMELSKELGAKNYSISLCVYALGQSMNWMPDGFFSLKLEFADEVILHVARDFLEHGTCLLWNTAKVKSQTRLFKTRPKEFCNLFIGQHKAFDFDYTNGQGYVTVKGIPQVATLKLYNATFKEMHRAGQKWKYAQVERVLTVLPTIMDSNVPVPGISSIMTDIAAVKNTRKFCHASSASLVRLEAIICVTEPHRLADTTPSLLASIRGFYEEEYSEEFGKSLLGRFDYGLFLDQLERTVILAVNTLYPIVKKFEDVRKQGGESLLCIPSIDQIQLAMVCEAIISFGIYGNMNRSHDMKKENRFKPELIKILKLKPNLYDNQDVFNGLRLCDCIVTTNDLLCYNGENGFPISTLETLPEYSKLYLIIQKLFDVKHDKTAVSPFELKELFEEFADLFWAALAVHAKKRINFQCSNDHLQVLKTAVVFKNHMVCENSRQFCARFFNEPYLFHQVVLAYVATEVKGLLTNVLKEELLDTIACLMEKKLHHSKSLCLLYPIDTRNSKISLVLPYFGTPDSDFDKIDEQCHYRLIWERNSNLLDLYQFAYHVEIGGDLHLNHFDILAKHIRSQMEKGYSRESTSLNDGICNLMGNVFEEVVCKEKGIVLTYKI